MRRKLLPVCVTCLLIVLSFFVWSKADEPTMLDVNPKKTQLTKQFAPDFSLLPKIDRSRVIKVGLAKDPPFSYVKDGKFLGVTVEIWEAIAKAYGWRYKFILMSQDIDSDLLLASKGKVDIMAGAVSTTHERAKIVRFSRPYYINRVGLVLTENTLSLWDTIRLYAQFRFVRLLLFVLIVFLVASNLYWLVEERRNPRISSEYRKGLSETMWMMLFHLFRGGSFVVAKTLAGRVIGIVWVAFLFFAMILVAATITSELTVSKLNRHRDFLSLDQLEGKRLAAVQGRVSEDVAKSLSSNVVITKTLQEALSLLQTNRVDGVVEDYPIALTALAKLHDDKLFLSRLAVQYDEYAFAAPFKSPYIQYVNVGITKMQDDRSIYRICRQYLDKVQAAYCIL